MNEFIVARVFKDGAVDYVASIDTFDGDTDYTTDRTLARIFRGVEWEEVWRRPGFEMMAVNAK